MICGREVGPHNYGDGILAFIIMGMEIGPHNYGE